MQKDDGFAPSVRKAARRLTRLEHDALAPAGLRSSQSFILAARAMRSTR